MTAENVVQLPLRPADDGASVQYAPRARAREAEPEPERRKPRLPVPSTRVLSAALSGGSALTTAPEAILTLWAGHVAAARFYRHWFARWPRYAWGAGHAFIEAPAMYLWVASGRSPLLRLSLVAVVLEILRLAFGITIFWSWL